MIYSSDTWRIWWKTFACKLFFCFVILEALLVCSSQHFAFSLQSIWSLPVIIRVVLLYFFPLSAISFWMHGEWGCKLSLRWELSKVLHGGRTVPSVLLHCPSAFRRQPASSAVQCCNVQTPVPAIFLWILPGLEAMSLWHSQKWNKQRPLEFPDSSIWINAPFGKLQIGFTPTNQRLTTLSQEGVGDYNDSPWIMLAQSQVQGKTPQNPWLFTVLDREGISYFWQWVYDCTSNPTVYFDFHIFLPWNV